MSAEDLDRSHGNPLLGALLDGRFGLLAICGFGGGSTVFEAWDDADGMFAAVKVLRLEAGDERALAALKNEAKTSRALAGVEGVPAARGFFEGEVGTARFVAFARNFVDALEGPPSPTLVATWGRTLAGAHARGRVHGDLEPGHFMSDAIIDWGSSSPADANEPALGFHERTASPELLRGEPATPASDWYAFAASIAAMGSDVPLPNEAAKAFERMLDADPYARINAAERWLRALR